MSTGRVFEPISMVPVMWTKDLLELSLFQVDSTLPLASIWPVQVILAFMLLGLRVMSVTWQSPCCGAGLGPPYLSIISWVTQTCVLCGPPMGLEAEGICIP